MSDLSIRFINEKSLILEDEDKFGFKETPLQERQTIKTE